MSKKIVNVEYIGNVTFFRNRRSKSIRLSVKPDKSVLVSYPFYISLKEALLFVHKNKKWIKQQQEKIELKKNIISSDTIIKTKLHTVRFMKSENLGVYKKGNVFYVEVNDFDLPQSQEYAKKCLTEIYRLEAKQILPQRLSELAYKHGLSYNKVTIRNNKRNWGSCSSKNNISLNLQMMKLPDNLIDSILLHELVHTEIKNHSSAFWNRLNQLTGNKAKELAIEIRNYSTYNF